MPTDPLAIPYAEHDRVRRLLIVIQSCLEGIALDREDGDSAPGAYLVVVSAASVADFADPMGENRWPETGRDPLEGFDAFYDALGTVARTCDGAVVVAVDGVVTEQLVRVVTPPATDDVEYAPWMGSRHMSALDVSTRNDVVAALTLSQESGRVSVFRNGTYESDPPGEFGSRWGDGA